MIERGYGRIINIGSVTCVAGYAGLAPLRRQPRRRQATHDEPRRRLGPARHHRQLPGPRLVQDGPERAHVRRRRSGSNPQRAHPRCGVPGSPTTSTAPWCSSPPTRAATSPAKRCWSTAASPAAACGPCRARPEHVRGRTRPRPRGSGVGLDRSLPSAPGGRRPSAATDDRHLPAHRAGDRAGRVHRGIGRADRDHDPRRAGRLHRALADRPELPGQARGPGRDGPLHDRHRRDGARGLRPGAGAAPGRELARVVVRGHGPHDHGPDRRHLRRRGPGDGHPGAVGAGGGLDRGLRGPHARPPARRRLRADGAPGHGEGGAVHDDHGAGRGRACRA